YPGIDVVYYGNDQQQLEYDFILSPGADPGRIGFRFDGVQELEVNAQGNLVLHLAGGDMVEHAPRVYQDLGDIQAPVTGTYVLRGDGTVGFAVGAYDSTRELVIDPVLTYGTYLGGSGDDLGFGIGLTGSNNIIIAGQTASVNFPTTSGVVQTAISG